MTWEELPSLIVARGSVALRPNDEQVRAWGSDRAIFISSVMSEFQDERLALADAIAEEIGAEPVLFERFGGRDEGAERAYLEGIRRSDVYVGVVGDLYGTIMETGRSATHEEYLEAVRLGKRISVWTAVDGSARQGYARDFVSEVRLFHTTGAFSDGTELVAGAIRRLREIAAYDLSPWVKLGDVAFRASHIEEGSETITLHASVRDSDVERALIELRGGRFGQQPTVYSDHSMSVPVVVDEVTRSSTSTATSELSIQLQKQAHGGVTPGMGRVTIQNYQPDQLVELGLRHSLLGEALPAELTQFGMFGVPSFTLSGIEGVDADAAAAVARVILVAQLVGGGHARDVRQVLYGGGQRGSPRLRVVWTSVDDGEERAIEGEYRPPAGPSDPRSNNGGR